MWDKLHLNILPQGLGSTPQNSISWLHMINQNHVKLIRAQQLLPLSFSCKLLHTPCSFLLLQACIPPLVIHLSRCLEKNTRYKHWKKNNGGVCKKNNSNSFWKLPHTPLIIIFILRCFKINIKHTSIETKTMEKFTKRQIESKRKLASRISMNRFDQWAKFVK
jgi:hypothetical protein